MYTIIETLHYYQGSLNTPPSPRLYKDEDNQVCEFAKRNEVITKIKEIEAKQYILGYNEYAPPTYTTTKVDSTRYNRAFFNTYGFGNKELTYETIYPTIKILNKHVGETVLIIKHLPLLSEETYLSCDGVLVKCLAVYQGEDHRLTEQYYRITGNAQCKVEVSQVDTAEVIDGQLTITLK